MAMHVDITAPGATVESGESVTLDAEAYGDLIVIAQNGAGDENLLELSQADDGTWSYVVRSSIGLTNLRNPRGLATKGGNLYAVDWWGEDIYQITDLANGTATEIGSETETAFGAPEGATFLGDVFWAIDQQGDDLWSWANVEDAPNSGIQRGSVTISGSPRGMTVRNGMLIIVTESGTNWAILQVDNTTTGASTSLASISALPTDVTGVPAGIQEYRGSLWIFTDDAELVEVSGIGDTPVFTERADFAETDFGDQGPGGICQFPVPSTYAWTSDNGGTFADATALSTTWDSTGVAVGTDVELTLTVTDEGGNTTSASVMVRVEAIESLALEAETGDPEAAFNLVLVERQELALEADTGNPEASFNLRAIVLQALALEAETGNPEAAFALRFIPQDVQRLALDADTGNPEAAFALRFIPQDVQELALEAAAGNPEAAFALTFIPQDVQLLMLEADTGAPIAVFDLRLQDAIALVTSELVSVEGGTYSAAVEALGE